MRRYFYSNEIQSFLTSSDNEIIGELASNSGFADEVTQKEAWRQQIHILKDVLIMHKGTVFFEYSIPRMGRRIDVVLIIRNVIFILEFKVGEKAFHQSDVEQVYDYALDLKNFHKTSHVSLLAPILVATETKEILTTISTTHHNDNLLLPIKTNSMVLDSVLAGVLEFAEGEVIDTEKWADGSYSPTPTIIEAAKSPMNPIHWFLNGKEDVRSSYYLEAVATEFHIQGLELDWTCVTWDADFRYAQNGWNHHSFVGSKWNHIRKEERKQYLKNAYRVLLTRSRQGMVIVVPLGDINDPTRNPEYYDPTFEYLQEIGFEII